MNDKLPQTREIWMPLAKAHHEKDKDKIKVNNYIHGAHEVWKNNLYTVDVKRGLLLADGQTKVTELSIKRNDKEPCNDWRHFQYIKNQLVGEGNDGLQLYPKESRLMDTSNQYYLYVLEDPALTIPFGSATRAISERVMKGGKQRPFPANMIPADLEVMEKQMQEQIDAMNKKLGTNLKYEE